MLSIIMIQRNNMERNIGIICVKYSYLAEVRGILYARCFAYLSANIPQSVVLVWTGISWKVIIMYEMLGKVKYRKHM